MSIRPGCHRRTQRDQRCDKNGDRLLLCHRLHQSWTASGSTFIVFNHRRLKHGHFLGNRNDLSGVDKILCNSTLRDGYRPPMTLQTTCWQMQQCDNLPTTVAYVL